MTRAASSSQMAPHIYLSPRSVRRRLAGLLGLVQLLGHVYVSCSAGVLSLGIGRRPGQLPNMHGLAGLPIEIMSSADAAIDSCVALATTASHKLRGANHEVAWERLLDEKSTLEILGHTGRSGQLGQNGDNQRVHASWLQDLILKRLGLGDAQGLELAMGANVDQADFVIDANFVSSALSTDAAVAYQRKQGAPSPTSTPSSNSLDTSRAVLEEAKMLLRQRSFAEAREAFADSSLRLAAYSHKIRFATGLDNDTDAKQLCREWVQLACDSALGASECCINLGQFADAVLEATMALVLQPDAWQALHARGRAYLLRAQSLARWDDANKQPRSCRPPANDQARLLRQAWKDLWQAHADNPRQAIVTEALDACREEMRRQGSGDAPLGKQADAAQKPQGRWVLRKPILKHNDTSSVAAPATAMPLPSASKLEAPTVETRALHTEASSPEVSDSKVLAAAQHSNDANIDNSTQAELTASVASNLRQEILSIEHTASVLSNLRQEILSRIHTQASAENALVEHPSDALSALGDDTHEDPRGAGTHGQQHNSTHTASEIDHPWVETRKQWTKDFRALDGSAERSQDSKTHTLTSCADSSPVDLAYTTVMERTTLVPPASNTHLDSTDNVNEAQQSARHALSRLTQSFLKQMDGLKEGIQGARGSSNADAGKGYARTASDIRDTLPDEAGPKLSDPELEGTQRALQAPSDLRVQSATVDCTPLPGKAQHANDGEQQCLRSDRKVEATEQSNSVETSSVDDSLPAAGGRPSPLTPMRASLSQFQSMRSQLLETIMGSMSPTQVPAEDAGTQHPTSRAAPTNQEKLPEDDTCVRGKPQNAVQPSSVKSAAPLRHFTSEAIRNRGQLAEEVTRGWDQVWQKQRQVAAMAQDSPLADFHQVMQQLQAAQEAIEADAAASWPQRQFKVSTQGEIAGNPGSVPEKGAPQDAPLVSQHSEVGRGASSAPRRRVEAYVPFDSGMTSIPHEEGNSKASATAQKGSDVHAASRVTTIISRWAASALADLWGRMPEMLTPAHLLRPRKLRPEVRELVQQCYGGVVS